MRTTFISALAVSAALLLAGCGSSDDSSAAPTGQNADVCNQFAASYNSLATLAKGPTDADVDKWTAAKEAEIANFKTQSGTATGDVKDKLTALVGALPADTLTLSEPDSESGQAYVTNANAVASACAADGTTITLDEFALPKFTN